MKYHHRNKARQATILYILVFKSIDKDKIPNFLSMLLILWLLVESGRV